MGVVIPRLKTTAINRLVTSGALLSLQIFFPPLENRVGHTFKKFGHLSENPSALLVSQADYWPGYKWS